ncbi:hypothetical protein DFH44_000650 [Clostridium beijerinckii]|nr:hypothetical protein [Clostridium beijerinckii]NRU80610.1 hypothetical protein [Clostridium beijerinckii]NRV14230.1 hypothetical protein [Clostridium beijerinckii]NRW39205.1 hypothetical protein [Clostridium beijerinckii]NRW66198.1 hypothetical protein [Clostridium beijerinckii]
MENLYKNHQGNTNSIVQTSLALALENYEGANKRC